MIAVYGRAKKTLALIVIKPLVLWTCYYINLPTPWWLEGERRTDRFLSEPHPERTAGTSQSGQRASRACHLAIMTCPFNHPDLYPLLEFIPLIQYASSPERDIVPIIKAVQPVYRVGWRSLPCSKFTIIQISSQTDRRDSRPLIQASRLSRKSLAS